jgi:type IV pilus assembly protein PilX
MKISINKTIKSQQGAVLIIGLIMLLLLTIIGMSSIRGTDLQERMAGNARDHNVAFQAAEAAVRSGESYLSSATIVPFTTPSLPGYQKDLTATPVQFWTDNRWKTDAVQLGDSIIKGVAQPPKYVLEQLQITISPGNYGSGVDQQSMDSMAEREVFRVTGRGWGNTVDSEALIQTTYIR